MRKNIIILILVVLSVTVFGKGIDVSGYVVREGQNQHNGIRVLLLKTSGEVVAESTTVFTGAYIFKNIESGNYQILVLNEDGQNITKNIVVVQNGEANIIKLEKSRFNGIYIFSNIMLLSVLLINGIIIFIASKSKERRGKRELIIFIALFSWWFISEFIRYIIGNYDEKLAAHLWAVSNAGTPFAGILTVSIVSKLSSKRDKFPVKIWSIIMAVAVISGFAAVYTGPATPDLIKIKSVLFMGVFYVENLVFLIYAFVLSLRESVVDLRWKRVSMVIFAVAASIVLLIVILALFSTNEIFDGFYKAVFSLLDILLFWGITSRFFGDMLEKERRIESIFTEIIKYSVMFTLVFIALNFATFEGREYLPLYFGAFVMFKIITDLAFMRRSL